MAVFVVEAGGSAGAAFGLVCASSSAMARRSGFLVKLPVEGGHVGPSTAPVSLPGRPPRPPPACTLVLTEEDFQQHQASNCPFTSCARNAPRACPARAAGAEVIGAEVDAALDGHFDGMKGIEAPKNLSAAMWPMRSKGWT